MNKTLIGSIALIALLGIGAVAAHEYGGFGRVNDTCSDDQTVGECRAALQSAHEAKHQQRCSQAYEEAFCDELLELKQEHKTELDAYWNASGYEKAAQRSEGAERPERPERPTCSEDQTVAACREAHQAARQEARLAACSQTYDADFCQGLIELHEAHKAEVEQLFADAGYEPQHPERPQHDQRPQGRPQHGTRG